MQRILTTIAILAATLIPMAQAQASGFSVNIGQPGFYGRIDIGGYPPPAVIYPQPIMIQRGPPGLAPYYLRVPPGHAKHWHKHCHSYRACGRPVYFVRDDWYSNDYAPRYRERHGGHRDYYRDERRTDFRHDPRYEPYDRRGDNRHYRGDDHGRGRGHGRGHDD